MFNIETINLFTKKRDSTKNDSKAKEVAQSELKKYECFNTLLNGKEECFNKCKNIILQDVLLATRSNTKINRDYLLGFQDALEMIVRDYDKYKTAMEKLN